MKNTYCVIMAGGIGSRFWPLSTPDTPKQFLDILGVGKTLIRLTFERFRHLCPPDHIFVVTNEKYRQLVLEQLPGLKAHQVLCEPFMRNTAPCIAYAACRLTAINPEAVMIAAPADHIILEQKKFEKVMRTAVEQANGMDCLVTVGIKPSRPDTGYGYIQFNEDTGAGGKTLRKVKTFTEKPEPKLAKKFIASGDFFWNSGIFTWSLKSINRAMQTHLGEVYALFAKGMEKYGSDEEEAFVQDVYQYCPSISIDYGIMEKADNVYMVMADFSWSDLGTWGSLHTHLEKDKQGNALCGKKILIHDSSNNMLHLPPGKLAVLQGLEDYIVVDSPGALLICKKEEEQRIRHFVREAKLKKWL